MSKKETEKVDSVTENYFSVMVKNDSTKPLEQVRVRYCILEELIYDRAFSDRDSRFVSSVGNI